MLGLGAWPLADSFATASFFVAAGGASVPLAFTATGLIVTPTALGLAVANFKRAIESGDAVDRAFAVVDLALAGYGTFHVAGQTHSIRIRETAFAEAAAARLAAIGRARGKSLRGAAGAMILDDESFTALSKNAGGKGQPIDPRVREIIDGLRATCVEPRATSRILDAGKDPRGAWSAVVRMVDGLRMDVCPSCKVLLRELGINDAHRPEYKLVYFLLSSFFNEANE